jgi:hypothetical protein
MQKPNLAAILLTTLIATTLFTATLAFAAVSVGVKKGDWVEYNVAVTGNIEGYNAQWARIVVNDVQGPVLYLNVTTQFVNGTYLYENIVLNLQTGQLGNGFFIPANLNVGDVFYDANAGNVSISGSEQKMYAGAERTLVSATELHLGGTNESTVFNWDKQTGIMLEAYSDYPDINFTVKTVVDKTNMWQPQASADYTLIYGVVTVIVIAVAVAAVLVWRSKKPKQKKVSPIRDSAASAPPFSICNMVLMDICGEFLFGKA